jgi:hypothetical protein
MSKRSKPEHPSPYLNDLIDSIDHQYDPGYWLGGKRTPLLIKYNNINKRGQKLTGITFILLGFLSLASVVIPLVVSIFGNKLYGNFSLIFNLIFSIAFIGFGVKLFMRARKPKGKASQNED